MKLPKTDGLHTDEELARGRAWFKHFLSLENMIIGGGIGVLVMWLSILEMQKHTEHKMDPILETIIVAGYLTMLVSYSRFRFPTFFSGNARMATFALVMVAGHVSLVFDSFAVVLLLLTLEVKKEADTYGIGGNARFNAFVTTVAASVCALTVGAGFWTGELWAIPMYLKSGYANIIVGLPHLMVLTPFNIVVAGLAAWLFPIDVEKVPFDRTQKFAAVEFLGFLTALVVTHNPLLCLGALLIYSTIRCDTKRLVTNTLHELGEGAAPALGLIIVAYLLNLLPYGIGMFIEEHVTGAGIAVLAAISSPFAGAMVAAAESASQLYSTISFLMIGAPMFVGSSLVAMIVYKDAIDWDDIPCWLRRRIRWLPGVRENSHAQEWVLFSVVSVPLVTVLAVLLFIFNKKDLFAQAYMWLSAMTGIG